MSVFEDTLELWYNAVDHDDVATITGPASVETLREARDRFEQLGNDPHDGCLVISIDSAREIPQGWVELTGPATPPGHEEFRPFAELVTITEQVGHMGLICRSDAVRLDMEILDRAGIVGIEFTRGGVNDE